MFGRNRKLALDFVTEAGTDGLRVPSLLLLTGWWRFNRVYHAIMKLEREGLVVSGWKPGPYPRSRLYYLPEHFRVEDQL